MAAREVQIVCQNGMWHMDQGAVICTREKNLAIYANHDDRVVVRLEGFSVRPAVKKPVSAIIDALSTPKGALMMPGRWADVEQTHHAVCRICVPVPETGREGLFSP